MIIINEQAEVHIIEELLDKYGYVFDRGSSGDVHYNYFIQDIKRCQHIGAFEVGHVFEFHEDGDSYEFDHFLNIKFHDKSAPGSYLKSSNYPDWVWDRGLRKNVFSITKRFFRDMKIRIPSYHSKEYLSTEVPSFRNIEKKVIEDIMKKVPNYVKALIPVLTPPRQKGRF